MGLGNKVPFTDKMNEEGNEVGELPNLKSQFDAVIDGLNEELKNLEIGGRKGMVLTAPRIEAAFDGLREGSNVAINFDLDENDFKAEAERIVRRKRKTRAKLSGKEVERTIKELIKEQIGSILKEHPILSNITQYEDEKATTMDVKGSRKIFLSVEPVKVTKVKEAVFNTTKRSQDGQEWLGQKEEQIQQLMGDDKEDDKSGAKAIILKHVGKAKNFFVHLFPSLIRKKYYRVRISVNFDRYWQDARQLIRSSEAYRVKKETEYIGVEEIIPEDNTVSRLEERRVLATEQSSVSPFDLAKEYPLYQVNEDPLPAFVQAPFGRMGKVFWQQLALHGLFPRGVTSQFNNGHPNLRIVGIFVPIGREKDLLASLQKDSIYGPLAGKVKLKTYSKKERGQDVWGEVTINGGAPIYLINSKVGRRYRTPNAYGDAIKEAIEKTSESLPLTEWQKDNITVIANAGTGYVDAPVQGDDKGNKKNKRVESVLLFKNAGAKWVIISAPWKEYPKSQDHTTVIYNLSDMSKRIIVHEDGDTTVVSPASCTTNGAKFQEVKTKSLFASDEEFEKIRDSFLPEVFDELKKERIAFRKKVAGAMEELGFLPNREDIKRNLLVAIAHETGEKDAWMGNDFPREDKKLRELLRALRKDARDHFNHILKDDDRLQNSSISNHVQFMLGHDLDLLQESIKRRYSGPKRKAFNKFIDEAVDRLMDYSKDNIASTYQMGGFLNTIHAWTNTEPRFDTFGQALGEKKYDGKKGQAGQIKRATTGYVKAAGRVSPINRNENVEGKATRVPTPTSSVIEVTMPFMLDKVWLWSPDAYEYDSEKERNEAKVEFYKKLDVLAVKLRDAINDSFRESAQKAFNGSMRFAEKGEMITSDMIRGEFSTAIFDSSETSVTLEVQGGRPVFNLQLVSWYDNEWGYVAQKLGLINNVSRIANERNRMVSFIDPENPFGPFSANGLVNPNQGPTDPGIPISPEGQTQLNASL